MSSTTIDTRAPSPLRQWVDATARHTQPDRVHWCRDDDGDREELERAASIAARGGQPTTYGEAGGRSPHQARIVTATSERHDAGPTNDWLSASSAQSRLWPLFHRCMRGRTLYALPYLTGPESSPASRVGVQLTDSPSLVLNLRATVRTGARVLARFRPGDVFLRALHSVGDPASKRRFLIHLPASNELWSLGTSVAENAQLGRKTGALRLASIQARDEGWLAENMTLLAVTDPKGRRHYIAAAIPEGCGARGLAMMRPCLPGWRVDAIGQESCWLRPGLDGRLYALDPGAGMARWLARGRARNGMSSLFTTAEAAVHLGAGAAAVGEGGLASADIDLAGVEEGVPLSAILFVTRRTKLAPLVCEARSWRHGVYLGATMASELRSPDAASPPVRHRDPMVMRDYCGYNIGDYLGHWLEVGSRLAAPPKIFQANWFRTDAQGEPLWPGGDHDVRVLKWIVERAAGEASAHPTAIGRTPHPETLDVSGTNVTPDDLLRLLAVDHQGWLDEAATSMRFLSLLGAQLPQAIVSEHRALERRLRACIH